MSMLPTLSSSTPMSDWFAQMGQMYNTVHQQFQAIQTLQERVAVLESRANIAAPVVVPIQHAPSPASKKSRKPRKAKTNEANETNETNEANETKKANEAKEANEEVAEPKKRGRKPNTDTPLGSFLREGEQVIARIPLGNRRFDEHAVRFQDGQLVLEDGQIFDHPTTMVTALAKILEDIGERSIDCSKSMNGWGICSVSRNGKRVTLEKLRDVPTPDTIILHS